TFLNPTSKLFTTEAARRVASFCEESRRPDYVEATDSFICKSNPFAVPLRITPYKVRCCPPMEIDLKHPDDLLVLVQQAKWVDLTPGANSWVRKQGEVYFQNASGQGRPMSAEEIAAVILKQWQEGKLHELRLGWDWQPVYSW